MDTLRALILTSPQIVLDETHQLTILPVHGPSRLLMLLIDLSASPLAFHLETRSRSVVATSIRLVSIHSVVSGHRHCSLVLVATGCLLVRTTLSLASVDKELLQAAGHGAVTVSCRLWGPHEGLDLIQSVQGLDHSQVALVWGHGAVHLAGETFTAPITTNLCPQAP